MKAKILCVDDDPNILEGYQRQFRKLFDIHTADGGEAGLQAIRQDGPFEVIVTDMKMPGMNGIDFLIQSRRIAPDSVRMMLTGVADLQVVIDALNEGHIYRFLTKPCDSYDLTKALNAAVVQHRLIVAEKELLEKTFSATVKVLTDILEKVNPMAFSRASRIRDYVLQIADMLELDSKWQYDSAAMLSQIGCVIIPVKTLEKIISGGHLLDEEREMMRVYPEIGRSLIESIPRLESVAEMIGNQNRPYRDYEHSDGQGLSPSAIGAQMLKTAIDLDIMLAKERSLSEACAAMKDRKGMYNPDILAVLEKLRVPEFEKIVRTLNIDNLNPGMQLAESVFSRNGNLVISGGTELTEVFINHLRSFVSQNFIADSFRIRFPV
jgi:response regulator RpfG family c-di-GMP phosphodiesterase